MNINVLEKEIVKAIEVEEELACLLVSKQEEKAMEDNFTNLKNFVKGLFEEYRGDK
jgi:thiamine biosynthesis lipoprotein ApbE|tara:strand:+ start:369 stop:536 length:168 start_codon:yes stop_codon:yes gene_type:complete